MLVPEEASSSLKFMTSKMISGAQLENLNIHNNHRTSGATTGKYAPQKLYIFETYNYFVFDPKTHSFTDKIPYPKHATIQST
jgi:hypothetical protein